MPPIEITFACRTWEWNCTSSWTFELEEVFSSRCFRLSLRAFHQVRLRYATLLLSPSLSSHVHGHDAHSLLFFYSLAESTQRSQLNLYLLEETETIPNKPLLHVETLLWRMHLILLPFVQATSQYQLLEVHYNLSAFPTKTPRKNSRKPNLANLFSWSLKWVEVQPI